MVESPAFNLIKNEPFNITKASRDLLEYITCGCGWKGKNGADIDVDLSAIFIDDAGRAIIVADYTNATRWLGGHSVYHYGDDLTGKDAKSDADNEQIAIKFSKLPASVSKIYVMASLFDGNLKRLEDCYVCLRNEAGDEILRSSFKGIQTTGLVMACIEKDADQNWVITRLDKEIPHRQASEAIRAGVFRKAAAGQIKNYRHNGLFARILRKLLSLGMR